MIRVDIPFTGHALHSAAAVALSWLAAPQKTFEARARLGASLGARALSRNALLGRAMPPATPAELDAYMSSRALSFPREASALQHALEMADIAMPRILIQAGRQDELIKGPREVSTRKQHYLLSKQMDRRDFRRRRWKPLLPVLHLGAALAYMAQNAQRSTRPFTIDHLFSDADIFTGWIRLASEWEAPTLDALRDSGPVNQVRVRLIRF